MKNYAFYIVLFLGGLHIGPLAAQEVRVDAQKAVKYILSNQKANGAFGPFDKEYTDLAWTYPAVHALKLLKTPIPRADECFKNGYQAWIEKESWGNGPFYWSFYQKANLYQLYNNKDIKFEEGVNRGQEWTIKYVPRKGFIEGRKYVNGEFFDMSTLWHMLGGIILLEGKIRNPEVVKSYVIKRQAKSGGFVDLIPMENTVPQPINTKAHIIITHDAVKILNSLNMPVPNAQACINWLRACQTPEGGFKWSPVATEYSNKPDVWYTWAAIRALKELGSEPKDVKACVNWLNSLQNTDGGFGDRVGWNSRLYSTYYAIESLQLLTGDAQKGITKKNLKAKPESVIPEGIYGIFQAHHKSPWGGSKMVDAVAAMKLNLVAVKSKEDSIDFSLGMSPEVKAAREYARQKGYPLEIIEEPENYSHRLHWGTGLEADHISNFMVPPDLSEADKKKYEAAFNLGKKGLPWPEFKEKVMQPIKDMGSLFYPELDFSMVNAYMVYDEGLDGKDGYNGVPGAHFKHNDWMRHFPYKERWEGVLPIIADGDAHGDIVKWRRELEEYRNVFIAKSYKYQDYVDASLNGRSVCVIHTPSGEVRYYGAKAAVAYLKKHQKEWQWWPSKQ